jgi:sugar-phosphatase
MTFLSSGRSKDDCVEVSFKAALLDMDGTVVDSTALVAERWSRWSRRRGINPDQLLRDVHGRRAEDVIRQFAPDADAAVEMSWFVSDAGGIGQSGVKPIPGAVDFVSRLPGNSWAVITSEEADFARKRLSAAGFPKPPVVIGAEDVPTGKPDPAGYLLASNLLGVSPADCLVFEDAPLGVLAARNAGMRVIGLLTTHPDLDDCCEAVIRDFAGLRLTVRSNDLLVTLRDGRD